MEELYKEYESFNREEIRKQQAAITWETDLKRGIYYEDTFSVIMTFSDAYHAYESKKREILLKSLKPPPIVNETKKKKKKKKKCETKIVPDDQVVEDLRWEYRNYESAMVVSMEEEGRYRPFAKNPVLGTQYEMQYD
ncbi:hypothetical protein RhiirB3_484379 [Rhizophagus irregularis]|nr:hypothetical protein RhiirB3_484379 [Rhizophagus irregularis]